MNIYLLSLLDKSIGEAMVRFSELPIKSSLLSTNHLERLSNSLYKVLNSYILFFQKVHIAPDSYFYQKVEPIKHYDLSALVGQNFDQLDKKLLELIPTLLETQTIPVHIHLRTTEDLHLFSGFGILDGETPSISFYLYELTISEASITYTPSALRYLDTILESENNAEVKSLRILVRNFGINYNQFQKDCKEYFGDTFHQFVNKMKMLGALRDQLFTSYSCKEIAHRNGFAGYQNMHFLFRKKYNIPFELFPRLLAEV
ncbi:hypothetical protein ATE47_01290 [Chryseobacterium sp. IHB B 17019]|uniref:helix-turn-helix domain-containing protein n=1 Tax=Chryseobacterium sp. IHB B 17019 TaxID=1721091 RepID=UPI000720B4C2|nr:helix-turn-helix domain-containing protein [Chryseobacterium sp. IHB B 17019]ALR29246.1 hypothetical protein ATE47_01290 [Chryseobacterium sp. IHB B 17019]